jgi:hypothetical protein
MVVVNSPRAAPSELHIACRASRQTQLPQLPRQRRAAPRSARFAVRVRVCVRSRSPLEVALPRCPSLEASHRRARAWPPCARQRGAAK